MTPTWTLHEGDARAVLASLPDASAHCCVTSPPYWNLRDYGVEGQIGLEKTPEEFLERLVAVFREVRRVLHPRGTLWLNMGDSYAGGGRGGGGSYMSERGDSSWRKQACANGWSAPPSGLKPKDMLMMPARLAIALQADGWWLRSEIVLAKGRPMPESVNDRPTKSHEMLYLLSKREHYFYDGFAVREPVSGGASARAAGTTRKDRVAASRVNSSPNWHEKVRYLSETRNARDVWSYDAQPLREEHFAAFPEELPRRCIRAGTPERGVCGVCLAPRRRVTKSTRLLDGKPWKEPVAMKGTSKATPGTAQGFNHNRVTVSVRTLRWVAGCECKADAVPSTVLDPFAGSGTTGIVALAEGRSFVGIDLNPAYAAMARRRIEADAPLFNRTAGLR